jgi:hypothetical protein
MVDVALVPAIKAALRYNELGDASPYQLSFARLGQSGASFGVFQGDCHTDPAAHNTLVQILSAGGLHPLQVSDIATALSRALPDGNPLDEHDSGLVHTAMVSAIGRSLVDAMDAHTLMVILAELDECIEYAGNYSIDPAALLALACWVNMTGAPTTILDWLETAPTSGTSFSLAALLGYLEQQLYFKIHSRNLIHFKDAVAAGAMLLSPAAGPAAAALTS